ncbi:MAG: hypothetical protein KA174_10675 [Chitinophagales bacterium]|jgi:hypothetical protein|nr:hypothetical protein [Saprospirales bacterium]MBK8352896.1 hypothetical protein [Saprospirales bacterium]MBP6661140.1 hypothetical protein [Chitinophagales bacterium]
MNIQLQKSTLIKQIELINDSELLKSIKTIVDYGLKHQAPNSFELSDKTKKMLDDRLADYYKNADDVKDFDELLEELEKSL